MAPISGEYRKTGGGNDEPRTDVAAARVGTWSRRDRRARAWTANPDRRTQGDGPRHTGNGRLCIEREQQGSLRARDEPGDGRAGADREDAGSRDRQAVAGQPADGDQP